MNSNNVLVKSIITSNIDRINFIFFNVCICKKKKKFSNKIIFSLVCIYDMFMFMFMLIFMLPYLIILFYYSIPGGVNQLNYKVFGFKINSKCDRSLTFLEFLFFF